MGWVALFHLTTTTHHPPPTLARHLANLLDVKPHMCRVPVGGYGFLEDSGEEMAKLRSFFEEIENTHQKSALGQVDDTHMPQWGDFFPRAEDEVGRGFFVEVDIHIPPERHDYLSGLPPAPNHTRISTSSLPDHMQYLFKERYGENYEGGKCDKLIASLLDKQDHILHHSTARMYARIGAQVVIKRALGFDQRNVMKPWVEKATQGRKLAALRGDTLLVCLYKLIVNAVFGKTIESIENHTDTLIIKTIEDQLNVLASPFLKSVDILDDDTFIATLIKHNMHLDRPLPIGVTILGMFNIFFANHPLKHHICREIKRNHVFFPLRCDLYSLWESLMHTPLHRSAFAHSTQDSLSNLYNAHIYIYIYTFGRYRQLGAKDIL